tara:strand:- start:408 stop:1676 length:1269 start_codon:yes stop_codon:yes gene_type:complete
LYDSHYLYKIEYKAAKTEQYKTYSYIQMVNLSVSSSFTLTRNLYVRDEVEASLLTALLKRHDKHESYFWAYELHYSGFDLFAVLWRIYYDVYFELNPHLEGYLSKKQNTWETKKDAGVFAACAKNMSRSKPTSTVFLLRQHAASVPDARARGRCYPGRTPSWCAKHPKKYRSWLRAISKKDYPNIACHTYCLAREHDGAPDEMFGVLLAYFDGMFEVVPRTFDEARKKRAYSDDTHYLLSIIVSLLADPTKMPEKESALTMTIAASEEELEEVRALESSGAEGGCPAYRMLGVRRLYGIAPTIGGFSLARYCEEVSALGELYNVNSVWERFAYETPYWDYRFKIYGGKYDAESKRVCFPTDDAREDFYDRYGLEPDEQSCAVRDRSLGPIEPDGWRGWYDFVFGDSVNTIVLDFEDTFRFTI